MVCMKIRNGFTLVELLAVIVILGIIIGLTVILYTEYINRTNEKIAKIEENNILNSAEAYYEEFKDTSGYIKDVIYNSYDEDGNYRDAIYSCVKLKSIIEQGYFKNDVTFKNYDENTIIKVETIKGVTSYKILEDSSDECNYYKLNKNFDSIKTVNTDISENDTSISFESSISNVIL